MPAIADLLIVLAVVGLASIVQNLTGFAFGLVFLGLVALSGAVPLADAANASMVLAMVNAIGYLRAVREPLPWRPLRHVLWTMLVGITLGVIVQTWLSANASNWLRLLLGVSVVGSAIVLLLQRRKQAQPSRQASFAAVGLLTGVLGGLFATPGPPIVYHLYRQPYDANFIRRCLVLTFTVGNVWRLILVGGSGHFSRSAMLLCAAALPVAYLTGRLGARLAPHVPQRKLALLAGGLLALAGLSLVADSLRHLLP